LLSLNSASSHNAFYIERDLTDWYNNGSLWDRISGTNGYDEFEGIFPGCTFDMSRNIKANVSGDTDLGNKKILILGCNFYINKYQNSTSYITYNHINCLAYSEFGKAYMNTTDTTVGGYYGSKMNQEIIGSVTNTGSISGTINEQLYAEFGSHLKTVRETLSSTMDASFDNRVHLELGCARGRVWTETQAGLLSEIELYGTFIYSGSGEEAGIANIQFPVFKYNTNLVNNNHKSYWLRDIATQTKFSAFGNAGNVISYPASNSSEVYIRPKFILA